MASDNRLELGVEVDTDNANSSINTLTITHPEGDRRDIVGRD